MEAISGLRRGRKEDHLDYYHTSSLEQDCSPLLPAQETQKMVQTIPHLFIA
jgi:hypothetical protein